MQLPALGRRIATRSHGLEPTLATVNLRDSRLEALCNLFGPEECIPTEVQYLDFPGAGFGRQEKEAAWVGTLRTVDALLVVLGAFNDVQNPTDELESIHLDLILPDMQIIENRLQRLALQMRSAPAAERQHLEREQTLLERIQNDLERGPAGACSRSNTRRVADYPWVSAPDPEAHARDHQLLRGTMAAR